MHHNNYNYYDLPKIFGMALGLAFSIEGNEGLGMTNPELLGGNTVVLGSTLPD